MGRRPGHAQPVVARQGEFQPGTKEGDKLLADERPHYIAAVFESGVPTFRHEMHAGYKANRVAAPPGSVNWPRFPAVS